MILSKAFIKSIATPIVCMFRTLFLNILPTGSITACETTSAIKIYYCALDMSPFIYVFIIHAYTCFASESYLCSWKELTSSKWDIKDKFASHNSRRTNRIGNKASNGNHSILATDTAFAN